MDREISVLVLVKGKEKYVFLYNEAKRDDMVSTFSRYASNPELSFNWYDAAVLSQKVRQESQQNELSVDRHNRLPLSSDRD